MTSIDYRNKYYLKLALLINVSTMIYGVRLIDIVFTDRI